MSDDWKSLLLDLEWSLIEGKWRSSLDVIDVATVPVVKLVKLVVDGEFREALSSDFPRQILTLSHSERMFNSDGSFNGRLESYFGLKVDADEETTDLARLAIAVAALHAFLQLNWTGPILILTLYHYWSLLPMSLVLRYLLKRSLSSPLGAIRHII